MNKTALDRCKAITKEIIEQPLNSYFRVVNLQQLPNYTNYVKNPIGLDQIRDRLDTGHYATPAQWHKDMCLVWENAMTYHPENVIWHKIAKYCLDSFLQKAHPVQTKSIREWYELLNKQQLKLTEKMGKSPIPQIVDPLVISSIKCADTIPPVSVTAIPDFVDNINKLVLDESCRRDIINILHETQPDLVIQGEQFQIDVDEIVKNNPNALNALIIYVNARC